MVVQTMSLRDEALSLRDELVADRRHFHRNPELGFQEHDTSAYVAQRLRELGVEVQTGVAGTGVVGLVTGPNPGRTVLLRADMDALPLTEETGAEYASERPGAMHACGHDGHTAILLGVAKVLMHHRDELRGTVKLVFQPAEEGPGGAKPMIDAGVMENPHVDACFGLHLANDHPVGTMKVQGGPVQASADEFDIVVHGVGGHGASPHQTVDVVAVGASIVNELHRIVSRELNPLESAVITIATFHAGTKHNIISPRATLQGTIRTLNPDTQEFIHRRIREVATHTAEAHRAQAEVTIKKLYPVTINDDRMADFARSVAQTIIPAENIVQGNPIMGSEDMSYFLLAAPGCFVFLGSANAERKLNAPHHSPLFDFDEECLPTGVELLSKLAMTYLDETAS